MGSGTECVAALAWRWRSAGRGCRGCFAVEGLTSLRLPALTPGPSPAGGRGEQTRGSGRGRRHGTALARAPSGAKRAQRRVPCQSPALRYCLRSSRRRPRDKAGSRLPTP
ncbi:hypothetical protein CBM2587_A40110 [Cupriavidus taiwanensis]|uniref:Uncharacterized protein n=1 Tax=Cupriavidus taiwanensis TaxID=164546 RepID=A0A976A265_9BURK|nr:hypothetical protein CBM2587_A40110 [Cupriavidus taiwanensis]